MKIKLLLTKITVLYKFLVFDYAISTCVIGSAKNIYLVGFDGHETENSARRNVEFN